MNFLDDTLTFLSTIDPLMGGGVGGLLILTLIGVHQYKKKKKKTKNSNDKSKENNTEQKKDTLSIVSTVVPTPLWEKKEDPKFSNLTVEELINSALVFDEADDKEHALPYLESIIEKTESSEKNKYKKIYDEYKNNSIKLKDLILLYKNDDITSQTTPVDIIIPDVTEDISNKSSSEKNEFEEIPTLSSLLKQEELKNNPTEEEALLQNFSDDNSLSSENNFLNIDNIESTEKQSLISEELTEQQPDELQKFLMQMAQDSKEQDETIKEQENQDNELLKSAFPTEAFQFNNIKSNINETLSGYKDNNSLSSLSTLNKKSYDKKSYGVWVQWTLSENNTTSFKRSYFDLKNKWLTKDAMSELESLLENEIQHSSEQDVSWAIIAVFPVNE